MFGRTLAEAAQKKSVDQEGIGYYYCRHGYKTLKPEPCRHLRILIAADIENVWA
jgi:hypothetical protein